MGSNPASQPDTSDNESTDASSPHRDHSDDILDVLLSDRFQEEFNRHMSELPKGDDARAEAHYRISGQFNLHYGRTNSLALLDHAIRHMEQALEEPPKSHEKRKTYVAVYTHLLQQKVMKTETIEDADRYVSGLCQAISLLEECDLREEKLRELGCAYLTNYYRTENIETLKLAIETLEQCFETTEKTWPQATISLGAALILRYQHYKLLDDVVHSIDLLRKGLDAIPRDDPDYAPLRDFGLDCLVSASAIAGSTPCGAKMRSQLIKNLDLALPSVPAESDRMDRIKEHRQALDESGKDPVGNAQLLRVLGEQFFASFQTDQEVDALDEAIRFAREALDDLPVDHNEIRKYADTLVFYVQTKCIAIKSPESMEEYVTAVQAAIDATSRDHAAHNHFVQRLAWAYWGRFERGKRNDDLDNVISYVNGLIDAHHDILPDTKLILGDAFHSRFSCTKATEDIEKSVELLEQGLKSPEGGGPARPIFLEKLVRYSRDMLGHTKTKTDINRLISNAKFAISELPQSESKDAIEDLLSRAETGKELLKQGPMLDSIFKAVGDLKLDDKNGIKPIGKTNVPQALYDKFVIGPAEIRTLEVMPGDPDEEIVCKFHTVALASKVEYEALSYTWGDPDKVADITVDSHKCKVTVNLASALRKLRQQETSRVLWVDAVCINQRDTQEKPHQLVLMGEIYERASQVLTWLGEPSATNESPGIEGIENSSALDSGLPLLEWGNDERDLTVMRRFFNNEKVFDDWPVVGALSTLALLARNCHLNTLPFFQDPRYSTFNIGIYPSDLWQQTSKALVQLLENPYWSRVWIVQEVVLGARVQVYYGRHIVPFQIFMDAERFMRKHYYGCCYDHCAAHANNRWSNLCAILDNLDSIQDLGRMKSSLRSQEVTPLYDTLLTGIDFRQATDPKDHIYGLLGLLPSHRDDDLLRPNYTISVAQVYTRAAFKIIRDSGSLRLLSFADRQCRADNLPSWCHDFAEKAPFNPQPYVWDLFNACNATDFKVDLDAEQNLEVRGFSLDTIARVTDTRTPESFSRSVFSRWIEDGLKLARKQCTTNDAEYMADAPIHVEEAYGRTLIGDTITPADGCPRRATLEDIKLLYAWIHWTNENVSPQNQDWPTREPPVGFNEVASAFLGRTQSRKLFTTKDKRLGMGLSTVFGQEKEVLPGDSVWLLQGSNLPVILRQLPAAKAQAEAAATARAPTGDHSHYAFVGTAYIHGIMDGEACPSAGMFTNITLGQYPESSNTPSLKNEPMRDALRLSLLLGHGSRKRDQNRSSYAPSSSVGKGKVRDDNGEEEEKEEQPEDAEALLFPEGRTWDESMKPIPPHRVLFSALFQNLPDTEEEWEELEKTMAESMTKGKENSAPEDWTD